MDTPEMDPLPQFIDTDIWGRYFLRCLLVSGGGAKSSRRTGLSASHQTSEVDLDSGALVLRSPLLVMLTLQKRAVLN